MGRVVEKKPTGRGKRPGPRWMPSLACALALAAAPFAGPRAAAALPPAGDVRDEFAEDPRLEPAWSLAGSWSWDAAAGALVSGALPSATAVRVDGASYTGSIRARVKLLAGSAGGAAQARIVFARDAATGACRFVQVAAGDPGSVTLAQAGTIRGSAPRTIRVLRTPIPRGRWLDFEVAFGEKGRVTVSRGGQVLFTETVLPLAPGQVGLGSRASKVAFDRFVFVAAPDAEPCQECHAAKRPAKAANVYAYWDGSWWDRRRGGSPAAQQGGHGDPGGLLAMQCTGGAGCHSMRLPDPRDHRNGVHEPSEAPTANPWHLRAGFIAESPAEPWDVQLTFDDLCASACHEGFGVPSMRHWGVTSGRRYLQLGYGLTDPEGAAIPAGFPLAADLTSRADPAGPRFGTCVTCHDPHGTATSDTSKGSNHMLRLDWKASSALCLACHV